MEVITPQSSVTYSECRMWARWLNVFTVWEMADSLGTTYEVGEKACVALVANGVIKATGKIEEYGAEVTIFEYVPAPPGPKFRPRHPLPEIMAVIEMGGFLLYNERGVTQYLPNARNRAKEMSIPGQGHRQRVRDKMRKRQEEARRRRAMKDRAKANGNGQVPPDDGEEWIQ